MWVSFFSIIRPYNTHSHLPYTQCFASLCIILLYCTWGWWKLIAPSAFFSDSHHAKTESFWEIFQRRKLSMFSTTVLKSYFLNPILLILYVTLKKNICRSLCSWIDITNLRHGRQCNHNLFHQKTNKKLDDFLPNTTTTMCTTT